MPRITHSLDRRARATGTLGSLKARGVMCVGEAEHLRVLVSVITASLDTQHTMTRFAQRGPRAGLRGVNVRGDPAARRANTAVWRWSVKRNGGAG